MHHDQERTDPITGDAYKTVPPWIAMHVIDKGDVGIRAASEWWGVRCETTMIRRTYVLCKCVTQEDAELIAAALNEARK